MKHKVVFVKLQDLWYADIPEYIENGGEFSDCLMVDGAPELIEELGGVEKLTVIASTEELDNSDAILRKTKIPGEDSGWAKYFCSIFFPKETKQYTQSWLVGLCPVNSWVFGGEHPDYIFIKVVDNE
jgi:hypothetical protein